MFTRSDIILAKAYAREDPDKRLPLIEKMHMVIENVYGLLFDLENGNDMLSALLAQELRDRLENPPNTRGQVADASRLPSSPTTIPGDPDDAVPVRTATRSCEGCMYEADCEGQYPCTGDPLGSEEEKARHRFGVIYRPAAQQTIQAEEQPPGVSYPGVPYLGATTGEHTNGSM